MRILLVEDDEPIAATVKQGLEDAGYTVAVAEDGMSGLKIATEDSFHLLILDVMLPGMDGNALSLTLRQRRVRTPILMLTARGAVEERVRGLDCGADDYLPKPFDFRELLARVRSLTRREHGFKARTIRLADLEIDTAQFQAMRGGELLPLNPREYELLLALASNQDKVFTREMIVDQVWKSDPPTSNLVDVIIRSLRRKMDDGHAVRLIQTVWGFGYVMRAPDEEMLCDAS